MKIIFESKEEQAEFTANLHAPSPYACKPAHWEYLREKLLTAKTSLSTRKVLSDPADGLLFDLTTGEPK